MSSFQHCKQGLNGTEKSRKLKVAHFDLGLLDLNGTFLKLPNKPVFGHYDMGPLYK